MLKLDLGILVTFDKNSMISKVCYIIPKAFDESDD
jgi:hypothetical protein